jgi:hypothetical protein
MHRDGEFGQLAPKRLNGVSRTVVMVDRAVTVDLTQLA